jgi:hypothetical protein
MTQPLQHEPTRHGGQVRYAIAGALSIVLAVLDLPWDRLRAYWSWSRTGAVSGAVLYAAAAAAAGAGAVVIAGVGSAARGGTAGLLSAVWQGVTGHALMRVSRSSDKVAGTANVIVKIRMRLFEFLDSVIDDAMLNVLQAKSDRDLAAIAIDLLEVGRRANTLSDRRRREVDELSQALIRFRAPGADKGDARCHLRSVVRAESLAQGATKERLRVLNATTLQEGDSLRRR